MVRKVSAQLARCKHLPRGETDRPVLPFPAGGSRFGAAANPQFPEHDRMYIGTQTACRNETDIQLLAQLGVRNVDQTPQELSLIHI